MQETPSQFLGQEDSLEKDRLPTPIFLGFPCGSADKESTCNAEDLVSIPGLGRSPGEGKGYPLQYSGLENSMDSIVHGVAKSRTRLSSFWRRKRQPTQVFLPGESHGKRSLVGYSSWDCKSWTQLSATKPPPPPGDIEGRGRWHQRQVLRQRRQGRSMSF